jgi:HEPN domain-containing protein
VSQPGLDARRFERAAAQRLTAAELLYQHGFNLESMYLAGYAIECALKSLILRRTSPAQFSSMLDMLVKVGAKGHDFEYLRGLLRREPINMTISKEINELIQRASTWSPDLRNEVGSGIVKDVERFLEAARAIREWATRG